jgi:hypothetical protein
VSAGKGMAPTKGYNHPAYRANYDRIFRCHQPRRQGNPGITVNQDTKACPECDASWVGSPIPAPYREYHGGATHYSLVLAVTDANADRVSHWRCPDCGKEWPA